MILKKSAAKFVHAEGDLNLPKHKTLIDIMCFQLLEIGHQLYHADDPSVVNENGT